MKGQYLIVNEVFLFALGILISIYIVMSFGVVQKSLGDVSTKDHFRNVADIVAAGVVKAVAENSSVAVSFPEELSERVYVIKLEDDSVRVYDFEDRSVEVTEKLFNIASPNCDNRGNEGIYCLGGPEILSPARRAEIYIETTRNTRTIKMIRA